MRMSNAGVAATLLANVRKLSAEEQLVFLRSLWRLKEDQKRAVQDWMSEQAKALRLRTNGEAPGWKAYEAAEEAFADALEAVMGA